MTTPVKRRLKILVVDDSADASRMLAMLLTIEGHEAKSVFDGASAIELAKTFLPDVGLLDLGMPRMDGFELATRLTAMPELSHTILVAMTGFNDSEDIRRTKECGFQHFLVKPVEPTAFLAFLATLSPPQS